ncbi:hypothetical protein BPLS_P5526 [Bathymodiolus platifrons methanotrophic gill symbiont]|uniref:hypothetical protein n=1 Tax=Bathymodiolus platifrons methanotrophic gill symbiont TaxID=113268 RepID=UPI000B411794|nr:hypothetical protein [Bathymodiolus platifrons methanotrophic gill symbiont]TXL03112.1 hypothetical protein BMR09_15535 [Methylococcaceae bacterium CS3]TXL04709.1 hypothetical protein BMR08_16445 [Methylococcaceae bacterium CS2]TXL05511.1 hypothetical protein BMR07_09595 [Methylococcaceae bacterium CS1]TXL13376.1 hypothetical protein BMR05_11815 [Methylococcaceae bacterium HT4]TXL17720.1 hypothetical protein BMR04_04385 [Methylococcaceae bacterium HT3]TXL19516.1 hypothetical protein BMR06_
MNSNSTDENSKGIRGVISIMGMILLIIGMVYSVQTEVHIIPTVMMIAGTIVILIAEKTTLNERDG